LITILCKHNQFCDVLHGIAAGFTIMKEQGFGQFINISSIGGHAVSPTAAVYCATKFAVRAISEGLRLEVGDDIRRNHRLTGCNRI
jgi:NADP-dependent 3-hydroxy acid dehydrogenase YdfG